MGNEINLDDLLKKSFNRTKGIVNSLKEEESNERYDDIDKIKREIELDKLNTEIIKNKFINDIKNGLGFKIKENPNSVIKVKKSFISKVFNFLNKLFR